MDTTKYEQRGKKRSKGHRPDDGANVVANEAEGDKVGDGGWDVANFDSGERDTGCGRGPSPRARLFGRVAARSRWRMMSVATSCGPGRTPPCGDEAMSWTRSKLKDGADTACVRRAARSAASRAASRLGLEGDGDDSGGGALDAEVTAGGAGAGGVAGEALSSGTGLYPISTRVCQIRSTRRASCAAYSSESRGGVVEPFSILVRTRSAMLLCIDARNWASATTRLALRTVLPDGLPALMLSRRAAGRRFAGGSGSASGMSTSSVGKGCGACDTGCAEGRVESLWK